VEKELDLVFYWQLLKKSKLFIASVVGVSLVVAMIISLLLPKIYTAQVTLMPLGGGKMGGIAMMASQMGLGGFLGEGAASSGSSTRLLVVMRSSTMAERMIQKYHLLKIISPELWDEERQRWRVEEKDLDSEAAVPKLFSMVSFSEDRPLQLIYVNVQSKKPETSAWLANVYVEELERFLNETTLTASKKNRIFIGEQLEKNRIKLLESGKNLADFYQSNRISNVNPTVDVNVGVAEEGAHPSVEEKLAMVDQKINEIKTVQKVPQQVYLQYLTLQRELLGQVNALLSQQYEMAKIEESKEDVAFQVIDWARVPRKRTSPQRKKIVMNAFAGSLVLSLLFIFGKDFIERSVVQRRIPPDR